MESVEKATRVGGTPASAANKSPATPGKGSRSASRYAGVGSASAQGGPRRSLFGGSGGEPDAASPSVQEQVNAAIAAGARPLPENIASQASASFGRSMSDVVIHTGPEAAAVASNVSATAAAFGEHLFFGDASFDPTSPHGQFVLMHELAHVAQSSTVGSEAGGPIALGSSSSSHEDDAGSAAAQAVQGASASVGSAPLALRGFNATGHKEMTKRAAGNAGFTDEEAESTYEGNWQRDFNIFLYPLLGPGERPLFEVLDIAHRKEFGRELIAEEFGTYDPVEHLDNPTGYGGRGYYEQPGSGEDTAIVDKVGGHRPARAEDDARREREESICMDPAAPDVAYVAVDTRYQAAADKLDQGSIINPTDAPAFQVDKSGFPAYLLASRTWLKERLHVSARTGNSSTAHVSIPGSRDSQLRNKKFHVERGADKNEGARVAGEASHTLQDYYAHSNFCEIGVNLLLEDQSFLDQLARTAGPVGDNEIDTGIHDMAEEQQYSDDAPESIDAKWDENSRTPGQRHVLGSSTYNNKDAIQSVKSNLFHFIDALDPFASTAADENSWSYAFVDWVENNEDFPGRMIVSTALNAIGTTVETLILPELHRVLSAGAGAHLAVGAATTAPALAFSELKAGATDLAGTAMSAAGQTTAAGNLHGSAANTRQAGRTTATASMSAASQNAQQLRELDAQFHAVVAHIRSGKGGTYTLYQLASNTFQPFLVLPPLVNLPMIGPLLKSIEARAKAEIHKILDMFKQWAKDMADAKIEETLGSSNAGSDHYESDARNEAPDGSSSKTHTAFSHTDMAKDFGFDGAARTGNEHNDHAEGNDHGHIHEGAWLAGLATEMAEDATTAVLKRLKTCWDSGADPAAVDAMDAEVDRWFSHPEDSRSLWEARFRTTILNNVELATQLVGRTHKKLRDQ